MPHPANTTQAPTSQGHPSAADLQCDVAIVGGGVAGLWLLELLSKRGYDTLLFEQRALGGAQSIASQGMIHGGIKYALGAALTGASEAISRMPERWRSCLAGTGEVDLTGVTVVANEYHMWSDGRLGKLGSFFASKALRGRVEALERADYPSLFATDAFDGTVHKLHDLVLDVGSLLNVLAGPYPHRLVPGRVVDTAFDDARNLQALRLDNGQRVTANQFIFTAGSGNSAFADALRAAGHSHAPATQLRPLHQAFVKHPDLQPLYAHCLTGIRRAEPRLTITSHPLPDHPQDGNNAVGWYIGGHLATAGVKRTATDQIEVTRRELGATLPWIDWSNAEISTLRIDRAEPRQHLGTKPDEACLVRCGNAMLCWPTKLSLVPDLGDQVLNAIDAPASSDSASFDSAPPGATQPSPANPAPLDVAPPPWL